MNAEILARERLDADRRYNDALTALDRAIVAASGQPVLGRADVERLATTLVVFLQQITAFVDSKDREVAGELDARISSIRASLDTVAELRTQMTVVQRAVQALSHDVPATQHRTLQAPVASESPALALEGATYVAFEDEFRGSDTAIAVKLQDYVPIFSSAQGEVVDLGCGRGELLAALNAAGVRARGVDANGGMAAIARERGLDAVQGDAAAFLESIADDSLGGVIATQVIEHLEPSYLTRLIALAARKLRAGAPIVLETINPACWLAFFSSYIRDLTHVRPVHPETLQYLLRAGGFTRVELRYSAPVPDQMKMKTIDPPAAVLAATDPTSTMLASLAHTINTNAVILNNLMFTHMDYAAIGYRS